MINLKMKRFNESSIVHARDNDTFLELPSLILKKLQFSDFSLDLHYKVLF